MGEKLPLLIVARGKTCQCEKSQLGFSNPMVEENHHPCTTTIHYTTHSLSGWMTTGMFAQYLSMLRYYIPYDKHYPTDSIENKIFLICDSFHAHHTPVVRAEAERLHIKIVPIPEGCTDKYQPLDLKIFGCLKQGARAYISQENVKIIANSINTNTTPVIIEPTKQDSIRLLLELWDNLSSAIIHEAWQDAIDGIENDDD